MALRIRTALTGDAEDIASVQWQSWQAAYLGLLPHEVLIGFGQNQSSRFWQRVLSGRRDGGDVLVAELDDEIVGFISAGPVRAHMPGYQGEFYAIYVLPEAQGCGIGTAMTTYAAKTLMQQRWIGAAVWVLEGNHLGRKFYERLGGAPLGLAKPLTYRGKEFPAVREVAYGWPDLRRAAWLVDQPDNR
jgi:GNAT superfamily N-acetyltransferase